MSKSGRMAGRAYVELGVDDKLTAGLKAAQARLREFGEGVRSLGVGLSALGGGVMAGLAGAAKVFADMGSDLHDMSQRTGVSVEALSELGYVAEQSGAGVQDLEAGLRKMSKAVTAALGGSESAVEAFDALGLSVADLSGMSPEALFTAIGDRLQAIRDPTARAAVAMEVFGKSGTKLLPMLEGGAAGLAAARKEAQEFGLTVSTSSADAADALGDAMGLVSKTTKKLVYEIGAALAPALTDGAKAMARLVSGAIAWVKQNQDMIVAALKISVAVAGVGAALAGVGTAIVALGAVLGSIASIWATLTGLATAFGTIMMGLAASPLVLVGAALAAAAGAALYFSGGLKALGEMAAQVFGEISTAVDGTLRGIADALKAGRIELAGKIALAGLKLAFVTVMAEIKTKWAQWLHDLQNLLSGAKFTASAGASMAKSGVDGAFGMKPRQPVARAAEKKVEPALDSLARMFGMSPRASGGQAAPAKEGFKDAAGQLFEDVKAGNDALADSTRKYQEEVDKARQELEKLTNQAAEAAKQGVDAKKSLGAGPLDQPARQSPVAAVEDLILKRSSLGTFNASAIQSLQAVSSPMQQVEKHTKQTAANTARLLQKAAAGGLTFDED